MSDTVTLATALKDACEALNRANERLVDARNTLEVARRDETAALNEANRAQKAFDEAVAAVRNPSSCRGTDWSRPVGRAAEHSA